MKRKKAIAEPRKAKASTEDILNGRRAVPDRVPSKWRAHYERLRELREHFLSRQNELARDAAEEVPSFSTHMADAGTDTYDRDLALGMLSSEQDALYQVEQALDRIRQGTYGICELTGRPIEKARLEAIPWARFSLAAECELEADGKRRRAHLGERATVTRGDSSSIADEEPDES
jgi:RNA polymerase-binding transcription factor DksA